MAHEGAPARPPWSPTTKLAAANRMRESLKDRAGLLPIAEAAVSFFVETFVADEGSITLLRGSQFRTLASFGEELRGPLRYLNWDPYPTSTYPQITRVLRSGRGYVASIGNDGGIQETQEMLTSFQQGSCIGTPIIYHQEVLGEVFVSRRIGVHGFNGKDLAIALDLARQLGFRVGPAVVAYDANNPNWWPLEE